MAVSDNGLTMKEGINMTNPNPQEAETFEWPDGQTVIDELPNALANELVLDEAVNTTDGKGFLIHAAFDLARQGEDNAAAEVLRLIRKRAGESDYARDQYEQVMSWVEEGAA